MESINVSVVVPVYNAEKYLYTSLESLAKQTLDQIEIIIINDGSTDKSLDIINEYIQEYPDKFVLINKANGGQASARNMGIDACKGSYIGFVDSDDYVDTTMFEKLYAMAEETGVDLVECGYRYLRVEDSKEIDLKEYCETRKYNNKQEMFIDPLVSPWNKLYKADLLKNSDVRFVEGCIYEDTAFYIKTIPLINSHSYYDEKLIHHILWPTSTMNANRNRKVGDIFIVLEDILEYYKYNNLFEQYFPELEYFCVKILLNSSLGRVLEIKDAELRNFFVEKTLTMINQNFIHYRRNKYLKISGKSFFMKILNKYTIPAIGYIYRLKRTY